MTTPNPSIRSAAIDELDLRFAHLRLMCPSQVARVRRWVERESVCPPALVSDAVVEKKLVVIDGFKRVEVHRELGRTEIAVRVLSLDAIAAQAAMLSSNAAQRGLSNLEEALIVQSLHRSHGLTQVEIAERLDHHKSWVCRRLALVEQLDPALREDVRLGLLSASVVRELVRLPRGNQARVARAIREHGLSSRQAGRLVRLMLALDPRAQEAALADPLGYSADRLEIEDEPAMRSSRDRSQPPSLADQLRVYLERIRAASRATIDLLDDVPSFSACPKDRLSLGMLAGSVISVAKKALTVVERHFQAKRGT